MGERMEKKLIVGFGSVMILICANYTWPQEVYPPIVKHLVTYYDFHSDRSNPEFEQPYMAGVHKEMVADTLGTGRKPLLGPVPYINYGIAKWFRPWVPGDFVVPDYYKQSGGESDAVIIYAGMRTVNYDTSFKNTVIQDTLEFQYVSGSPGIFQYSNANFFPLDGKGFGNGGRNHNYSFAMEFHDSVPAIGGLTLTFGSGDDMWVYMNNRLVADLGGIHQPETSKVVLDTLKGLIPGTLYPLDVYYSERHSAASSILMSWIAADKPLLNLSLKVAPPFDTVLAGDSIVLNAAIVDNNTGKLLTAEYDTGISWAIFPSDNFSWVTPVAGSRVTFHGNAGYRTYKVFARFSPDSYHILRDSTVVAIKPGEATRLLIEPYPVASQYAPDPVDSLVILATETHKEIAAVIRDRFGNFVRFDSSVTWQSGDSGIVQVRTPDKPYVCLVERVVNVENGNSGTTFVLCKKNGLAIGTVRVVVRAGILYARCLERSSNIHVPGASKEYYNLRGQKLEPGRTNHLSGIIFERITSSDGSIHIRKVNSQNIIRYNRTGGFK
jgi:fibro-slime domain-containing protein